MPDLVDPKKTIEVIQNNKFVFQKRFGQNFLIDAHVLNKIIDAAEIGPDDTVLEIGPGIGTMTQALAENAKRVVAIEIDENIVLFYKGTLIGYKKTIIEIDKHRRNVF
mgnify:CR=1 FL=1